jgi:hypothetical protein
MSGYHVEARSDRGGINSSCRPVDRNLKRCERAAYAPACG